MREEITDCVQQAGIECKAPLSPGVTCPGIVVLDGISAQVCELVRELGRNGTGRILVLACDGRALEKGGVGASCRPVRLTFLCGMTCLTRQP